MTSPCRDARSVRPLSNESYSIVALTGMDALRLDTLVRPYRATYRCSTTDDLSTICIVLNLLCLRVPKLVPLLELFSSKGGTFRFLRRNWKFPALENKISSVGKESFQGRKRKFPALEIYFSNAGKFLENLKFANFTSSPLSVPACSDLWVRSSYWLSSRLAASVTLAASMTPAMGGIAFWIVISQLSTNL